MNGKDSRNRRRSFRRDNRNNERPGQDRTGHGQSGNSGNPQDHRGDFHQTPSKLGIHAESGHLAGGRGSNPPRSEAPAGVPHRSRKRGDRSPGFDKNPHERPRWVAPKQNIDPLPVLKCNRCGKSIADINSALIDKKTGEPVHFDCAITELAEQETLEEGDVLSYIGGGRFGIVHFNSGRGESRSFTIKKIVEWEDKEKRVEWRSTIANHYSVT